MYQAVQVRKAEGTAKAESSSFVTSAVEEDEPGAEPDASCAASAKEATRTS